jgi:hypothetical protein
MNKWSTSSLSQSFKDLNQSVQKRLSDPRVAEWSDKLSTGVKKLKDTSCKVAEVAKVAAKNKIDIITGVPELKAEIARLQALVDAKQVPKESSDIVRLPFHGVITRIVMNNGRFYLAHVIGDNGMPAFFDRFAVLASRSPPRFFEGDRIEGDIAGEGTNRIDVINVRPEGR